MNPTPSQPELAPNSPVGVICSDPLFSIARLIVLEDEPQDAGEYMWRVKPTDPWRRVRQYWRDDILKEGWSSKIIKFHDSGEVVDARKLPEGEWAIKHNSEL